MATLARELGVEPVALAGEWTAPPWVGASESERTLVRDLTWAFAAVVRASSRAEAVQAVFARHTAWFEAAEVALARFDSSAAASAHLTAVRAGDAPFPAELPDDPVPLESFPVVGYAGLVMRGDLPAELAEAAFDPDPAPVVGPVRFERAFWLVWRLMAPHPVMNEGVYRCCEDLLVEERLAGSPVAR
ncbi:MAG: hypothetical protein H6983_01055 [Ectothiorhodospiraceae bacterium]|nr:hypothetical protein [Ectothiorhodospiraceae bacterium]